MSISPCRQISAAILLVALFVARAVLAQTTAFSYQGKLTEAGNPANGNYDMEFKLFDTPTVGTGAQQGPTIPNPAVQVTNGNITVQLDFGANVFTGSPRYLEIGVRPSGSPNPYTVLAPRQAITSSPYAIQTINAQQLGGLSASRYVATDVNGNAAIGAGTAAHRLAILGGPCWTGDCWGGALELENSAAIAWRANSANVKFGIGRTENGLFFFRTTSPLGTTTSGPTYDFKMDNLGNVGIGNLGISTDLSGAKLNLFTGSGYGFLQSNGTVSVGSYVDSTGGWYGTKSRHPLHFFTDNSLPQMTMNIAGNIGIGTSSPTARLQVDAGSNVGIQVNATNNVGLLANSQGNAIIGTSTGAGFAAVYGENTSGASGYGVYGKGTTGYAMYADGNAGQRRDKGGMVKAMVYVQNDGAILGCYNGQTGSSSGNCGFTVNHFANGGYGVNFGFQVGDRFIAVTTQGFGTLNYGVNFSSSGSTVDVRTFISSEQSGTFDNNFMIIVF